MLAFLVAHRGDDLAVEFASLSLGFLEHPVEVDVGFVGFIDANVLLAEELEGAVAAAVVVVELVRVGAVDDLKVVATQMLGVPELVLLFEVEFLADFEGFQTAVVGQILAEGAALEGVASGLRIGALSHFLSVASLRLLEVAAVLFGLVDVLNELVIPTVALELVERCHVVVHVANNQNCKM